MIVDCYWNIRKHCWSVRHKGKVVAHVSSLYLTEVTPHVSKAGQARVRSTGHKNVHAFLRGYLKPDPDFEACTLKPKCPNHVLISNIPFPLLRDRDRTVSYNPFKDNCFMLTFPHGDWCGNPSCKKVGSTYFEGSPDIFLTTEYQVTSGHYSPRCCLLRSCNVPEITLDNVSSS